MPSDENDDGFDDNDLEYAFYQISFLNNFIKFDFFPSAESPYEGFEQEKYLIISIFVKKSFN